MEFTDVYGLPCLGEEDYPALPAYMKSFALQLEGSLTEQQDAMDAFMDVGSAIWGPTVPQALPANTGTMLSSINVQVGGANLPQPIAGNAALPPIRGWYYFGGNLFFNSTGAPTAGSIREFQVIVSTLGALSIGTQYIEVALSRQGAFLAGQDAMWCAGTVFHTGLNTVYVDGLLYHNDPVPMVTDLAAPSRIFVCYLGDSPDIKEIS